MRPLGAALAAALSLGCALAPGGPHQAPTAVWIRSHNRSAVDVYLLCGDRNARWLGVVPEKATEALELPEGAAAHCLRGLNFFLVVRRSGWGYWVGPVRPARGEHIQLVIEKYAGLSSVRGLHAIR
jgi:hypothetical protein